MVGSWAICDAPLLPSAAVAVLLALFAIRAFRGVGARTVGLRNYSRTFAMYALMMCCSITTHCFFLVECGTFVFVFVVVGVGLCSVVINNHVSALIC